MWLVRLASRNLLRNKSRTLISGLAIALCVALVTLGSNFEYGAWQDRLESSITGIAGHVVVNAVGYHDEPEPEKTIGRSGDVVSTLNQVFPDKRVLRRVQAGGLLQSPRNTARAMLMGVDPSAETPATKLDDAILDDGVSAFLPADEACGSAHVEGARRRPCSLVIGQEMADTLQVEVGDKVVFMTQIDGEMESVALRVAGIFDTGVDLTDGFMGMVPIQALQPLLPGDDPAHQVVVHLTDEAGTSAGKVAAVAALQRDDLDVRTWWEALPELQKAMELDRGVSALIYTFIGLIIAVVILSTILMSVAERTREIGVLLALGMRPAHVAQMVLIEALILGIVFTAAGLALQAPGTWYFMTYGVDYGDLASNSASDAGVVYDTVMKARIDWYNIVYYSISGVVLTVIAGVWPAWRATRLQPVEAMRHV